MGKTFQSCSELTMSPDSTVDALIPLAEYDWTCRWALKGEQIKMKVLRRPLIQSDCVLARRERVGQQERKGCVPRGKTH